MGKQHQKKVESESESDSDREEEEVSEKNESGSVSESEEQPARKVKEDTNAKGFEAKVSGLSYDATQDDVESYFNKKGCNVESIKLIQQNGRSKGLAFVKVSNK